MRGFVHQSPTPAAQVLCGHLPVGAAGQLGVSGSRDGVVALWDARAAHGPQRTWQLHGTAVASVALSTATGRVASCAADGSVSLADVRGGAAGWTALRAPGELVAQRALQLGDDYLLTAGDGGTRLPTRGLGALPAHHDSSDP